jgi:hypothetical protein
MTTPEQDPSKVDSIIYSPVVSTDSNSQEAKLMRDAKKTEAQSQVDTKYDGEVAPFMNYSEPISVPLLGVAVALSLLTLSIFLTGKRIL